MVPRKRNYHIYSKHSLWVNSANFVYFSILSVFPKLGLHFLSRANLGHLVFLFFRIVQLSLAYVLMLVRGFPRLIYASQYLTFTYTERHPLSGCQYPSQNCNRWLLSLIKSQIVQRSHLLFVWSWRHVSRVKAELTLGTKYPFRTVAGASSTIAWPVSAVTVERIS